MARSRIGTILEETFGVNDTSYGGPVWRSSMVVELKTKFSQIYSIAELFSFLRGKACWNLTLVSSFRGFPSSIPPSEEFSISISRRDRLIRIIAIEFKVHLQEFPSFTFPYFSGHDLSARFRHKISRLAKYVELFGGFSMGRKTGRLWIARVQKERRVRTVRRYEEVSR